MILPTDCASAEMSPSASIFVADTRVVAAVFRSLRAAIPPIAGPPELAISRSTRAEIAAATRAVKAISPSAKRPCTMGVVAELSVRRILAAPASMLLASTNPSAAEAASLLAPAVISAAISGLRYASSARSPPAASRLLVMEISARSGVGFAMLVPRSASIALNRMFWGL